jgi:hypothetical protein
VNKNFIPLLSKKGNLKKPQNYLKARIICNILEKKAKILGMQSGLVNEIKKGGIKRALNPFDVPFFD